MKIACIGGGPAGLYFAILMKKADPGHRIAVYERNQADDTFGWGIVFSDATLDTLAHADWQTHAAILRQLHHWDTIDILFKGTRITSGGHGFAGISRATLLHILHERARELGVELHFETDARADKTVADCDLIVAADGIHSGVRDRYIDQFKPQTDVGRCRYLWLGAKRALEAFTFAFEETQWGWFQLHAYRFDRDTSSFIIETREETWRAAGLHEADVDSSLAFCERLFPETLQGARLLGNERHRRGSQWLNFRNIFCTSWYHGNIVLIGDAAHTAHFSIGSGTKLAMEDAIALAAKLHEAKDIRRALALYQEERSLEARKLQNAARNRMQWFENVARYARLDPLQFSYSLLTGSQRIGHENLRLRDQAYVERVETALVEKHRLGSRRVPPMFLPLRLRAMELANRVVVSPMSMYSAEDGIAGDFHLVHYGARAIGGAGLLVTEMTHIAREARISPGCAGMYRDEHVRAWKRVVDFVHAHSHAKIAVQLGHAGPKGSTQLGWEQMDQPLARGNWSVIAPSPIPYGPKNQVPQAMTRGDMERVQLQFVRATEMALQCGFDMIELHCAHGYLLSAFITPLTNQRDDEYGGPLENRLRYPLRVFRAMRTVWPQDKPMAVRISATDWVAGGITAADAVQIAQAFKRAGCDLIDVSTGQTSRKAQPIYGRMFQTPFADQIRNEVDITTMAVGNIFEPDHINSIVAAGRADLVALARPHLANPNFTLHAAAALGYAEQWWPPQYLLAKTQLERNSARAGGPAKRFEPSERPQATA